MILTGNLANDPETHTTQSGVMNCTFRLAVQRNYKDKQTGQREADFINIVAWRQTAELCAKYLSKGRKAGIEGSLQTRSYTAQDGTKRYVTEVIADNIEFLSPRADTANATANTPAESYTYTSSYEDDPDGSLPF